MPQSWKSILAQLCGILVVCSWVVADASASTYSVYAIRVDRWLPGNSATPVFGTAYTAGGLKLGVPPDSAVGLTSGGGCAPRPASTPCVASWGTGPPGPGTSQAGRLLALGGATNHPPVWVPPYVALSEYGTHVFTSNELHPGYVEQTRYYSRHNQLGIFYPSHANAPTAPMVVYGATNTTRSGGNYGMSRGGYMRVNPGANRFGGTMRFFSGPDFYYVGKAERPSPNSFATYRWNAIRTQSNSGTGTAGPFGPNPPMRNTMMGLQTMGQTATYGSSLFIHSTLPSVSYQYWGFSTLAPWTTGMVTVHQSLGPFPSPTHIQATGSDTRTLTSGGGLVGNLSLVQPSLYHSYPASGTVGDQVHLGLITRVTLTFMPEPTTAMLLSTGIVGLGLLYRLRRR